MIARAIVIVAAGAAMLVAAGRPAVAQQQPKASTKPYRGTTNANKSDYSVSFGGKERKPRNYDLYYNQGRYQRPVVPRAVTTAVARPAVRTGPLRIGAVDRYSDEEYSKMILESIETDREQRAPLTTAPVEAAATPAPDEPPADAAATLSKADVTSVTEEGILVAEDGTEVRLRGVMFPAFNSSNDTEREASVAAVEALKTLLTGATVYYTVEEPSKDGKGRQLAIVHLQDGTEVNRLVVESGLGRVNPYDFATMADADRLMTAQRLAAAGQRGVWGE